MPNPEQAVALLLHASNLGDTEATYLLAQHYRWGSGVIPDLVLAKKLLERAAQEGHKEAQEEMKKGW